VFSKKQIRIYQNKKLIFNIASIAFTASGSFIGSIGTKASGQVNPARCYGWEVYERWNSV
jgi:hypothetical protein